jgi:hypothetical protein
LNYNSKKFESLYKNSAVKYFQHSDYKIVFYLSNNSPFPVPDCQIEHYFTVYIKVSNKIRPYTFILTTKIIKQEKDLNYAWKLEQMLNSIQESHFVIFCYQVFKNFILKNLIFWRFYDVIFLVGSNVLFSVMPKSKFWGTVSNCQGRPYQ